MDRLTDRGWLMCYPLSTFNSEGEITKLILNLEEHEGFPCKSSIKKMLTKATTISNKGATVTNPKYVKSLDMIDRVYKMNGWN